MAPKVYLESYFLVTLQDQVPPVFQIDYRVRAADWGYCKRHTRLRSSVCNCREDKIQKLDAMLYIVIA
jgi:hypothetical protein